MTTLDVTRGDDPVPDGCLDGDCSWREAVIAANEVDEALILFSDNLGAVVLSRQGAGEDAGQTGDLDIFSGNITIKGLMTMSWN